ncbi:MAG: hypothetical protein HC845_00435 [Akkermansiaceae bacterium]|nr:hypothetical protein [Akkermansiaceae bacterium]
MTAGKPEFDDFPSPKFSTGKDQPFAPKDWLSIELKLQVQLAPAPKSKTCDKITVKWFVAVKDTEKSGNYLLLTKEIDYVNVPLEEDIYCSVYLSPASVRRLTGSDRNGKAAVEAVGYEIHVNGEKKAEGTDKLKDGWWSQPSERISRSDAVPLLKKNETPFANMWWDRYAEVSVDKK